MALFPEVQQFDERAAQTVLQPHPRQSRAKLGDQRDDASDGGRRQPDRKHRPEYARETHLHQGKQGTAARHAAPLFGLTQNFKGSPVYVAT